MINQDAGDGYGYEDGEYCLTRIRYRDEDEKVEWDSEGKTEFRRGTLRVRLIGQAQQTPDGLNAGGN